MAGEIIRTSGSGRLQVTAGQGFKPTFTILDCVRDGNQPWIFLEEKFCLLLGGAGLKRFI